MDDQVLMALLQKLEPGKAPASMDEPVLSAAEQGAARLAGWRRRRWVGCMLAGAAALMLLAGLVIWAPEGDPDLSACPSGAVAAEGRETSLQVTEEALYVKARLLEMKLDRLKRSTARSRSGSRYRADLFGLERELRTMDPLFRKGKEGDRTDTEEYSPKTTPEMKNKGVNHDEEDRPPVHPSLRPDVLVGRRPGKTT